MTRLWNRNFSIVTIGSFISALGSAAAGVAFGILVYTETGSPLMLAMFFVANVVPRIVASFLAGPYVDRHSRRNIIVTIDYFYSLFFLAMGLVLFTGFFNVWVFTAISALIGTIDTIYQTAFMSLFPETVPKGSHSKAYSIASLIWPLSAAIMAPIAAYFIDNFSNGTAILMIFNAVTFVVTASIELLINVRENLNDSQIEKRQFITDIRESIHYFKHERGILGIALLFGAFAFVYAVGDLLRMPFFVSSPNFTIQDYSFLISAGAIGRIVGGLVHYVFRLPVEKKFTIAIVVYFTVEVLDATMLFMPYILMITMSFIVGLLGVTSFNIRMAATQTYVSDNIRGRVNATQQLIWNFGSIAGAVAAGLIAEYSGLDYRIIIMFAAVVSISSIFLIPLRMKDEFKKIYNVEV